MGRLTLSRPIAMWPPSARQGFVPLSPGKSWTLLNLRVAKRP